MVILSTEAVEHGLCGLGVVHAVDAGARRQHALSRHFRAGGELEHLIDAVQVGGVDVEQRPVIFWEEDVVCVVVFLGDEFAR